MAELALDDVDRSLILHLRSDGRVPTATLARRLGVSRGTVQNRIDRLIAGGVILGFTVRLRGDVETGRVRAITALELRAGDKTAIVQALKRFPDVSDIHSTNGRWDLIVEINTPDLATLDRVLHDIRAIKGVSLSETSILLSSLK
jgi:DNA-binding Lrp family transcriptional regulator